MYICSESIKKLIKSTELYCTLWYLIHGNEELILHVIAYTLRQLLNMFFVHVSY